MRLRAQIKATGKTAAGVVVPDDFVVALGAGRHPRVRVAVAGYTFRSSIASMGGVFMLPITAETRERAGVAAGEAVDLEIEVDSDPREVALPDDFAAALGANQAARARFENLSYSNQRRLTIPIETAKAEETRRRRIEKAISELSVGQS